MTPNPWILCLALLLFGCADSAEPTPEPGPDAGVEDASMDTDDEMSDTSASDVDTSDVEADAAPPPGCLGQLSLETTFEVAPEAPSTQIHASAAFEGEALWITWSLPDPTNGFDIWAAKLGCDGKHLVAPFKVNTTDFNDLDSEVAIQSDNVVFTWQSDNSQAPDNLDILVRVFSADGAAREEADRVLATTRLGAPLQSNAWMPRVVPHRSGTGFVMAGIRGLPEIQRFQAFLQPLDGAGQPVGDTVDGFFEAEVTQSAVDLALLGTGETLAGWTREDEAGAKVALARYDIDGAPVGQPTLLGDGPARAPSLSASADGGAVFAAWWDETEGGTVRVGDALAVIGGAEPLRFGDRTRFDHTPRVAAGADGGGVAFYRIIRGIQNEVVFARFRPGDNGELVGEQAVSIPTDGPAAPYQPALTHVGDDNYLLVWSEGTSPDFRLKARFVR